MRASRFLRHGLRSNRYAQFVHRAELAYSHILTGDAEGPQLYLGRTISGTGMLTPISVLCMRNNMPTVQKAQKGKAAKGGSTARYPATRYFGVGTRC